MHSKQTINLDKKQDYFDTTFTKLQLSDIEVKDKYFENCIFLDSNFNKTKFISCRFVDCEFKDCDLSSSQFSSTSLNNINFYDCKLIGINWTIVKWPYITLTSPIKIFNSNISFSSFYELNLPELIIENCKAHEVDFREATLSNSSCIMTDFYKSLFMHTNLYQADFTNATSYNISPLENNIKKAKFSVPDVIELLQAFEIEIKYT